MSTSTKNRLQSRYAGIALDGDPHPLSPWFVVALRIVIGGMLLFTGIGKVTGDPFDAYGYLANVDAASPLSGMYAAMAGSDVLLATINVVVPASQLLIGLALIVGVCVRLAALGGALQMGAFFLGGWQGDWLALFDSTLVYLVVFLTIGALAAGRIGGVDAYLEQLTVGGAPLIERYPKLGYLLG